jgi:hypothetical protein
MLRELTLIHDMVTGSSENMLDRLLIDSSEWRGEKNIRIRLKKREREKDIIMFSLLEGILGGVSLHYCWLCT